MKNKVYTVLILSKKSKEPYHFLVSTRKIQALASVMAFVFMFFAWTFSQNQTINRQLSQLQGVENEKKVLEDEYRLLASEVTSLRLQMEELDALTRQVRGLAEGVLPEKTAHSISTQEIVLSAAGIEDSIYYLREKIPQKAAELETLMDDVVELKDELARTPDIMPTSGRITSPFGIRRSPFSRRNVFHYGVDIGAPYGTPVHAAANGIVLQASYQRGYGNLVIISHGKYTTYYAHLSRIHVKRGKSVEKGELIGKVGSTGYSTGPHLHYEIHKGGSAVDPLQFFEGRL